MTQILLTGIGGQGAQTIGKMLIEIYLKKGFNISYYPYYGSQMRGGNSSCVVKFDKNEIVNPCLSTVDIYVAMDSNEFLDNLKFLKENSIVIVNVDNVDETLISEFKSKNHNIIEVNASKRAIDFGMKNAANIVMYKKLIKVLNIDSNDAIYGIEKYFKDNGKEKYIEKNIQLFNLES